MSIATRLRQAATLLVARCRIGLGLPAHMATADRAILEQEVLAALARDPAVASLLFVGCDWYTAHYERLLTGTTVYTLDPDPRRWRYGAARHRVGTLQELDSIFANESFDAIVCNGVYGWGLDTVEDCERAFCACAARLRRGGWFVLGWNNVPQRDPAPLAAVKLQGLLPAPLAPLDVAQLEVAGSVDRHTFAFFRRSDCPLASTPSSSATDSRTAPSDVTPPQDRR